MTRGCIHAGEETNNRNHEHHRRLEAEVAKDLYLHCKSYTASGGSCCVHVTLLSEEKWTEEDQDADDRAQQDLYFSIT